MITYPVRTPEEPTLMYTYAMECKYELLRYLRTPARVFPTLLMPIFLYLLIGVVVTGNDANSDPKLAMFLFSAFSVFAITSPGIYGIGQALAIERQFGLLTLKRTQPVPAGAYVIAKIVCALLGVIVTMSVLIFLATTVGNIKLDPQQVMLIMLASLLGMTTFCALGLFIGSIVSGSAAPGILNLIYFPMMYLSGTFFPLPEALAPWAMLWPTFYLNQILFIITVGENAISVEMCIAVLIGLTVLFAGLATRRLTHSE